MTNEQFAQLLQRLDRIAAALEPRPALMEVVLDPVPSILAGTGRHHIDPVLDKPAGFYRDMIRHNNSLPYASDEMAVDPRSVKTVGVTQFGGLDTDNPPVDEAFFTKIPPVY